MEIKEYANEVKRTLADLGYKEKNNIHMLMGLSTEVGELTDIFKKNFAYNTKIDWVNVEEEICDIMWYLINLCNINGIDIEKALDKNISKLKARYPEKFDEELARNRNLELERKILEK